MNQQQNIDKILCCNPYKAKQQFLIGKYESTSLKHLNDSKDFIEYSDNMDDISKYIEEYNPNKKRKIHDMIADMLT